jgi:hypothetical protein
LRYHRTGALMAPGMPGNDEWMMLKVGIPDAELLEKS